MNVRPLSHFIRRTRPLPVDQTYRQMRVDLLQSFAFRRAALMTLRMPDRMALLDALYAEEAAALRVLARKQPAMRAVARRAAQELTRRVLVPRRPATRPKRRWIKKEF